MTADLKSLLLKTMDENRLFAHTPAHVRGMAAEILVNAIVRNQAESDVVGALKHLIYLKEHKDTHGKTPYYECEQPFAWQRAKAALAAIQDHGGARTGLARTETGTVAPASQVEVPTGWSEPV